MESSDIAIKAEFAALLDCMPILEEPFNQAALQIYASIAISGTAGVADVAAKVGLGTAALSDFLDQLPGVYRDDGGNVIGFWGLTAKPVSRHVVVIDGKERYAWCAWDTLFLPRLLGKTLTVRSRCPKTEQPIELTVDAERVLDASPSEIVLSMVVPDKSAFQSDVVSNFCHHIHFFPDAETGRAWATERNDVQILSLERAFALGRVKNLRQFGAALEARTAARPQPIPWDQDS